MYVIVHPNAIANGSDNVDDVAKWGSAEAGQGAMDTRLREEITERVRQGDALDDIEAAVLPPRASLDEDERSALWLFAWVGVEQRARFVARPGELVESVHD